MERQLGCDMARQDCRTLDHTVRFRRDFCFQPYAGQVLEPDTQTGDFWRVSGILTEKDSEENES